MKRLFALFPVILWLVGCTWTVDMRSDDEAAGAEAPDPFFVEAQLFYPERIALPGDAEMLVAVDAVGPDGRKSLTRFSTRLEGRQVPVPLGFSVQPESNAPSIYELSAAVLVGDELLRLTGPVLVMPEDGRAELGEVRLHEPIAAGFGQAWQCGGTEVMFGAVDEHLFLAVDGQLHSVEQVPAASGVRYRAGGESQLGIHEKGGEILLLRGDEAVRDCRRLEPLSAPVSGGGNEPGWRVEIGEKLIELTSDYGQTVTTAPIVQTGSSGRTTRFRGLGEHGPILAAFERSLCRDSATGMPHPYTVAMQFEDGRLGGCGGKPLDLLTASTWRVVQLAEDPVPDAIEDGEEVEISLQFDDDGRVAGRAACNRYTAGYELSGEGLSVGPAAATKMACREPLMSLEKRFLDLLAGVQRFDIGDRGELILVGPQGRITAVDQGL
ncbi:META domain-containing protein [Wenzhouxiangella sediminis]|uniref:META domain-containing protein n=1 Tax=Wenzhouxiangella sediminis TaxID=1792836 RepID=A0A3E1KD42_9GAMM|nr:META domain-containing protein [Wenzhouxiangella sediminis]RFF33033.1 META domain-containing protein [Wenzhouxiangella sediminis]